MSHPAASSNSLSGKRLLYLLLGAWFLLNILQATFTQLEKDEPYYWLYSKEMAWGYFDHPPAVALLIFLSDLVFNGELGVRFFTALITTGTLYIIWILAGRPSSRESILSLFLIFLAMPFIHIYGFISTPDPPLLFFSAFFFLLYRNFLEKNSWLNAIAIGLCAAALLYSKYHGILVIGFVLFSNLRLLRDPKFYLAVVIGIIAFFPHIYWQFDNEFPSIKYHVVSRSQVFELKDPISYFLNQLVIFSPFLFPFMVKAMVEIRRPQEEVSQLMLRAFYFVTLGFWLFFIPFTIRGHIEPHWTVILSITLGLILYHYLEDHEKLQKWVHRAALVSIGSIFVVRLLMLDLPFTRSIPFMHYNEWVKPLEQKTEGRPVIFLNHFRDPARFQFYTGIPSISISSASTTRRSQFDLWDWEKDFHHQDTYVVGPPKPYWECESCEKINISNTASLGLSVDSIEMVKGVEFWVQQPILEVIPGDTLELEALVYNPYPFPIDFQRPDQPIQLKAVFLEEDMEIWELLPETIPWTKNQLPAGYLEKNTFRFRWPTSWNKKGIFGFCLQNGEITPALPRLTIPVKTIKEKEDLE